MGAVGLLFFMLLILLSVFGHPIPPDPQSRGLVVIVLALVTGLSSAFLGGYLSVNGDVPIPLTSGRTIAFSGGGGIGVLILVLVLGFWLYVPPDRSNGLKPSIKIQPAQVTAENSQWHVIVRFEPRNLSDGDRVKVEISSDPRFNDSLMTNLTGVLDNWKNKEATIRVKAPAAGRAWIRLKAYREDLKEPPFCTSESLEIHP